MCVVYCYLTFLAIFTCRHVNLSYIMKHFPEQLLIEQTLQDAACKANIPTVVDTRR